MLEKYNPGGTKLTLPKLKKLNEDVIVKNIRAWYRYYGDTLLWLSFDNMTVKELIGWMEDMKADSNRASDGKYLFWRGDI